jgi:hypothetical protein
VVGVTRTLLGAATILSNTSKSQAALVSLAASLEHVFVLLEHKLLQFSPVTQHLAQPDLGGALPPDGRTGSYVFRMLKPATNCSVRVDAVSTP